MSVLTWFDLALRPTLPAERLAALRIVTGLFGWLYLLIRAGHFTSYAHFSPVDYAPVGVVSWFSTPLPTAATYLIPN
jgi:hypothetical protein